MPQAPPFLVRLRDHWCWLASALLLATASAQSGSTQPTPEGDAETRAAMLRAMFVVKIPEYLTLAKSSDKKEYCIAVVGADHVATVAQKHLPGKKVVDALVKVIAIDAQAAAKGAQAATYDLVYIAASVDADTVKKIIESHATKPVPLVCERSGFATLGGGVQLFVKDNGVRFEVNAEALKKQGIQANAQLMKLSRKGPN